MLKLNKPSFLVADIFLLIFLSIISISSVNREVAQPQLQSQQVSDAFIDSLSAHTFHFFWDLAGEQNGQIPDRWPTKSFSSIAATGFGLTSYLVGVERGYITRAQAADRVLKTLLFFKNAKMGSSTTGITGYRGFFYHFIDMVTGVRFEKVELSTIDTGLLIAGILSC